MQETGKLLKFVLNGDADIQQLWFFLFQKLVTI